MMIMFTPEKIAALREALGLSVVEFAKLFGVHRDTVYAWENGSSHPRFKLMVRMNQMAEEIGLSIST